MKKAMLTIVVSILALGAVALWLANPGTLSAPEIVIYGVIILLVAFGFYIGYIRLRSVRRGEPAEDEFSKRILQRASSLSYYISLYLWLGLMYVTDKVKLETQVLLGSGILGMAVTWVMLVFIFKIRGLKDA